MEAGSLPEALKMIMESRGWSQGDLARELGVSQGWVSEVSRGLKDTGFAKSVRLLARVGWEVKLSPRAEGPVERREFVAAAASVIFVPSRKTIPFEDPAYVRTLADSLARNRYELGGVPLVTNAVEHLRRARRISDSAPDHAALQMAISELANQVTLVLYDAGKMDAAERAGRIALNCALQVESSELQARSYDALSRVCADRGDAIHAVKYAQLGLRLNDVSNSQLASLHMRLGRALALIPGQESPSRIALDQAQGVGGLSPFGEAALIGDVGIGFGSLKSYDESSRLLNEAAELIGQWSPLFRAQYLGRQAVTALKAGDPSHAADRITELARALPFVSSARVSQRAQVILKISAAWGSSLELSEAGEHLKAVIAQR
ncbi:helix-turn-helix domain-containing protein [Actinomadura roseirufa]|uniref:helix-turn-helix domain-containing protein n=1 Tax=Actinomadura roseirufa TaxID=2094049 RepID=UPI001041100D|nr:helix-turn-helix transcriptional regulator [Actinomadura roseirufa]